MIKVVIILISIFIPELHSQSIEFKSSIGDFSRATSFYITSNGIIYVTDSATDEITSFDTLGNYLKDIGGYGWGNSQFDYPADVYADPLSVYVTDKNNHRIQRFDKNLNYISSLYKRESNISEEQFAYPIGTVISSQGDMYVLDSENKRVMKFDLFGNFIFYFGGIDAGNYSLTNPKTISVSPGNNIFISDGKRIVIFDQYGNGLNSITLDEEIINIEILFNQIVIVTKSNIYYADLYTSKPELKNFTLNDEVKKMDLISAIKFNNKLYILTPTEINVFNIVSYP